MQNNPKKVINNDLPTQIPWYDNGTYESFRTSLAAHPACDMAARMLRANIATHHARVMTRANFACVMVPRIFRVAWPGVMAVGRDVPIAPPG